MITLKEIQESKIRALTWKEPFATAMLKGKINETREWIVNLRGLVLICVGLDYYRHEKLLEVCGSGQLMRLWNAVEEETHRLWQQNKGKAIAIGRLVGCWPMAITDENEAFVQCKSGLYVHRYEEVRAIKPFPFTGNQKWTTLTEEQKQLIELI